MKTYKVQLTDGRVKEFESKEKAYNYAEVTRGKVVKKVKKVPKHVPVKQFKDRK